MPIRRAGTPATTITGDHRPAPSDRIRINGIVSVSGSHIVAP
jgi:hypothetical protein